MTMSALEIIAGRSRDLEAAAPIEDGTSVREFLKPLETHLRNEELMELCINRPGEAHVELADGWHAILVPEMTRERCLYLARAVATLLKDRIDRGKPILSGDLPTLERIQIVIPPAVRGEVSITIRRPSARRFSLDELEVQGMFARVRKASRDLLPHQKELLRLKRERRFKEFLREAMRRRLTIVTTGETGTGKTTLMRALLGEIDTQERIVTIEDAHELQMPDRANKVHLIYTKGAQPAEGVAPVTPQDLLASCMRMRPDRIFLAELRGAETFDFVSLALSGHDGSMTSMHAASPEAAFRRMAMLCMQSQEGRALPYGEVQSLLHMVVDVVLQLVRPADRRGRHIDEIYYDPHARLEAARALIER
jgi:type IV secretion system protein VirB11